MSTTTSIVSRKQALGLAGVLGALVVTFAGCRLPDLSAFRESASAVRAGLDDAEGAYRPLVATHLNAAQLKSFDKSWRSIEGAADALLAYAQSLDAIATAGKTGEESAKELAGAVDSLLSRVGVAGIATSKVTQVAAKVWGTAVQGLAAKKLSEAVEQAHPKVDAVCRILSDRVVGTLYDDFDVAQVAVETKIDDRYPDVSGAWDLLQARRGMITSNFGVQDPGDWDDDEIAKLDELDKMLDRLEPRAREWQAAIAKSRELNSKHKELLQSLAATMRALAAEHGSLQAALKANRELSLSNVRYAADRLMKTIEEIKALEADSE